MAFDIAASYRDEDMSTKQSIFAVRPVVSL